MKKVAFGIVGIGNQGSYYALGLFGAGKIENGYIAAMCDTNEKKIEAMKAAYPDKNVKYFTDYKEMLDSGLVQAVMVEVPHYTHPEIVIECLKRDINVICEKPAGVYTKQVRQMNEVAATSSAKFGMMFNTRTDGYLQKMKEIIAEGGIGNLQRVVYLVNSWYRTQYYYDTGSWRATWKGEGGGVLFNQCPHQLDALQWVLGEMPNKIRAICHYGKWHDIEVEDDVTAYMEFRNGATGVLITTTGEAAGSNRLEISGTKGKLILEGRELTYVKLKEDAQEFSYSSQNGFHRPESEVVKFTDFGMPGMHEYIINNFANAVLGIEELFVPGVEGIHGVELMDAIELSGWRNGAEVTIPVNEDEYYDELQKYIAISRFKEGNDDVISSNLTSFQV